MNYAPSGRSTRPLTFPFLCATLILALIAVACSSTQKPAKETAVVSYQPASAERIPPPAVESAPPPPPIATGEVCQAQPAAQLQPVPRFLRWLFSPSEVYAIDSVDVAGGTGDVHFTTFRGKRYDFQGVGEFVAIQGPSGAPVIQVRQQPYGSSTTVSVTTAIAMNVAGDTVGIYAGQTAPVRANHRAALQRESNVRLPHGGQIRREGSTYLIVWPNQTQVRVSYGSYFDYFVTLCPPLPGPLRGLLGNPDAAPDASLQSRNGTVLPASAEATAFYQNLYHVFGDSWRIAQPESLFDYAAGQSTETFTDRKFPYQYDPTASLTPEQRQNAETACRKAGVVTETLLRDCTMDVAVTGEAAFAANTAMAEALLVRSGVEGSFDSIHCLTKQDGNSDCTLERLSGTRVGTTLKLTIETLQAGAKAVESVTCGPITEDWQARCQTPLKGRIFEGGRVSESVTAATGEPWERTRPIRCKKSKGELCGE